MKSPAALLPLAMMVLFACQSLGAPLPTGPHPHAFVPPKVFDAIAKEFLAHHPTCSCSQDQVSHIISTMNNMPRGAEDLSAVRAFMENMEDRAKASNQDMAEATKLEKREILSPLFVVSGCGLDLNGLWDLLTLGLLKGVDLMR